MESIKEIEEKMEALQPTLEMLEKINDYKKLLKSQDGFTDDELLWFYASSFIEDNLETVTGSIRKTGSLEVTRMFLNALRVLVDKIPK